MAPATTPAYLPAAAARRRARCLEFPVVGEARCRTDEDEYAMQVGVYDRVRNQSSDADLVVKSRYGHDGHADSGNQQAPDRFDGIDFRLDAQCGPEGSELLLDQRAQADRYDERGRAELGQRKRVSGAARARRRQ